MSKLPLLALRRFGFRQTIRGALLLGVIVGLLMGAQGAAYAKAFPTVASRQKLVASLESFSGANFLSGEVANAARPDSYAVYKSIALTTVIAAVWGLLTSTRLLRGFEEDGRLEVLEAGALTKRQASAQLLLGFAGAFAVSVIVSFLLITLLGSDPQVKLSVTAAALMTAAVFLPGVLFGALGILTAQLARTRGRAVLYGLVPLVVLYVLRGTANSVSSVNWIKNITPFGWSDRLNPVLAPQLVWMLPTVVFSVVFVVLGLRWAGRRDLGAALLKQSEVARPHYPLLGSPLQLAVRQNSWNVVWWGVGAAVFAAFFAAVANLSTNLANDSPAFERAFSAGSANQMKLLFLGVGTLFSTTALLVMTTLNMSGIRRDEARGYLDNLLVQPVPRRQWLRSRLWLAAVTFVGIQLVIALVTWTVAHTDHITIGLGTLLMQALSLSGVLLLTLGIGALFYGFVPRLAVAAMSVVIGWAFVLDILKAFFHLNSLVINTSILTYIPANPSKAPDWVAIAWLVVIGLVLAVGGTYGFSKRDIIAE